jgi:hypothetical protein
LSDVTLSVNGVAFATIQDLPPTWLFTVPAGVSSLTFTAAGSDAGQTRVAAAPLTVAVTPDPTVTVSGRVVDETGNPLPGATVQILSEGVDAELFDVAAPLTVIPALDGRQPDRITRMTAVNMRNPGAVFGADPLGSDLAPDFVGRITGWLSITSAGPHTFIVGSSDGARLTVGGVAVVDAPVSSRQYREDQGTVDLLPGRVPVELVFYQGVGNGDLQLMYQPPAGGTQVVPPSALTPSGRALVVTTDADGRFTIAGVPTALASLQVRAVSTGGQSTSTRILVPAPSTDLDVGTVTIVVRER